MRHRILRVPDRPVAAEWWGTTVVIFVALVVLAGVARRRLLGQVAHSRMIDETITVPPAVWTDRLRSVVPASNARRSRVHHMFLVWFCSLTISLCASCGSGLPHLVVYQHGTERVVLQDLPPGYPLLSLVNHPAAIRPDALSRELQRLRYRRSGALPLAWQPPRLVFTERQHTLLAAQLAKAFAQVLAEEVVAFNVHDETDREIYTSGFCFVAGHELHLVIEHLREFTYVGEPKPYQQAPRWELLPGEGQRLFATGSSGQGADPHWIVLPLTHQ